MQERFSAQRIRYLPAVTFPAEIAVF